MKESEFLHVGDPVWWREGFGHKEPKLAEVEEIEYHCVAGGNRGIQAVRLNWRDVRLVQPIHPQCDDDELIPAVVTLTNGYWAYGWQLRPLRIWARTYDEQKIGSLYQVDIVIPYTFTVEAEDEQEAEYKAFEEFLNFQGPPDYQVSRAKVTSIEKVRKESDDRAETNDIQPS